MYCKRVENKFPTFFRLNQGDNIGRFSAFLRDFVMLSKLYLLANTDSKRKFFVKISVVLTTLTICGEFGMILNKLGASFWLNYLVTLVGLKR